MLSSSIHRDSSEATCGTWEVLVWVHVWRYALFADSRHEKGRTLPIGSLEERFVWKDTTEWRMYSVLIPGILGCCAVWTANRSKVSPDNAFESFLWRDNEIASTPVPRPNITYTGMVKTKWAGITNTVLYMEISHVPQENQTVDLKIWAPSRLLLFVIDDETNMFTVLLYPQGFSSIISPPKVVINQVNWKLSRLIDNLVFLLPVLIHNRFCWVQSLTREVQCIHHQQQSSIYSSLLHNKKIKR